MSVDHAARHVNARDLVLEMLVYAYPGWVTHRDLDHCVSNRYGARLHELRRLGYLIESQDISGDTDGKRYRLASLDRGDPTPKHARVYLFDDELRELIAATDPGPTRDKLVAALASYERNKDKL